MGSSIDDEEKARGGVFALALGETSQYAGAVYKNISEGSNASGLRRSLDSVVSRKKPTSSLVLL